MENKKLTDDELLRLLDGMMTTEERQQLTSQLEQYPEAMQRLKELETIHSFLQMRTGLEQPSHNFTDRVMKRLRAQPAFTGFSPRHGLLLLIGLCVAGGLALVLLDSGTFDQWHTIFKLGNTPIKNNFVKMPSAITFDGKTFVKIFVLLSLVLGFILLDRTILRPIFQKRAERFS